MHHCKIKTLFAESYVASLTIGKEDLIVKSVLLVLSALLSAGTLSASCPTGTESLYPTMAATASQQVSCASVRVGTTTFVAAVFSNGAECRLRILEPTTSGAVRLVSESDELLAGFSPSVTPIDFDRDGRQELLVNAFSQNDESAWVFRLGDDGTTTLLSIGTNQPDGPITFPQLVDIDGDGKTDIVDVKLSSIEIDKQTTIVPHYRVYTFRDTGFTQDSTATLHAVFTIPRKSGKPTHAILPFDVPITGEYRVSVANGSTDASDRCSAGIVKISDRVIFAEADFKQHSARMETTATLKPDSVLDVELRSAPDCHINVWIASTTP